MEIAHDLLMACRSLLELLNVTIVPGLF